ncbi:MAG: 30S ribosome-binding factor RbfA [Bacteroidota bacterium]
MATSIRTQKVARLLQKALGEIFLQETASLLDNTMVTVTEVRVSPDLGLAKVYLSSVLNGGQAEMMVKVEQQKGTLRKLLGARVGNKLRKVPELRFYPDNSVAQATKINQLLDELDIPEGTDFIQNEEFLW